MKNRTQTVFVALALLCASLAIRLYASPGTGWSWRNPLPTGNQLSSVAYGNGLFVAVGSNDTIITSSDGATWTQQVPPLYVSPLAVVYGTPGGSGLFVAVGTDIATMQQDVILTSPDGITWTVSLAQSGSGGLPAVAYGNNEFVAVGYGGQTFTNGGGSFWSSGSVPGGVNVNGVAYGTYNGSGVFVAVGDEGSIFTSLDGINWNAVISPPTDENLVSIASDGNQTFVAMDDLGDVFCSTDGGTTWSSVSDFYYPGVVTFVDGEFVVMTDNYEYHISPDFASGEGNWTEYYGAYFYSIAWNGSGTFAGVGYEEIATNLTVLPGNEATWSSSWDSVNTTVTMGSLAAIAYGQNLFVAGGQFVPDPFDGIVTSSDGNHWQADEDPSIEKYYDSSITGLAYGINSYNQPLFVATFNGSAGVMSDSAVIAVSSDGNYWTNTYETVFNYENQTNLNAVAYGTSVGQPLFVAVGGVNASPAEGIACYSSDGTNWDTNPLPLVSPLNAVTFGNGQFVAAGDGGVIAFSPDGASWGSYSAGDLNWNGITFGNGVFVAVGDDGEIAFSVNPSTAGSWSSVPPPTTSDLNFVTYGTYLGSGLFVACGDDGTILVSSDGVHWTPISSITSDNLAAVGFGDSQFLGVGDSGTILGVQSGIKSSGLLYIPDTGAFTFNVSAPPGMYDVYVSHDLNDWDLLQPINLGTSAQTVTDRNAGNFRQGYYRLVPYSP